MELTNQQEVLRMFKRSAAAVAVGMCLMASAGASTASAYTWSSAQNVGSAKSLGIACDSDYNWVRQNWPFFRDRRIDAYGELTSRFSDRKR